MIQIVKIIIKIPFLIFFFILPVYSYSSYNRGIANVPSHTCYLIEKEQGASIEDFIDSNDYFIVNIDVNNDSILDKVVSSNNYVGSDLYFFQKGKEDRYSCVLRSINFSEDGGCVVTKIVKESDYVVIYTSSAKGDYIAVYYIKNQNGIWVLDYTNHIINNWQEDYTKTYHCSVKQSLDMSKLLEGNYIEKIKPIPEEGKRNKLCKIEYWSGDSLSEFLERFQMDQYGDLRTLRDTDRYRQLLMKFPVTKERVTQINNIAYYLELAQLYEESVFLLKEIVQAFPNRTVAYINLGDAYWGLENKEKALLAYKKYIELMTANNKEAKIPNRIWDRINND